MDDADPYGTEDEHVQEVISQRALLSSRRRHPPPPSPAGPYELRGAHPDGMKDDRPSGWENPGLSVKLSVVSCWAQVHLKFHANVSVLYNNIIQPSTALHVFFPPIDLLFEPLQLFHRHLPLSLADSCQARPAKVHLGDDPVALRMISGCEQRFLPSIHGVFHSVFESGKDTRAERGGTYLDTQRHHRHPSVSPSNPGRGLIKSFP